LKSSPQAAAPTPQLARPADRLAAVILDAGLVLAPLVLLCISPLRRQMTEDLILRQESHFVFATVMAVVSGFFIAWVYQTYMLCRFGATFGKMFFGLRVVRTDQDGPLGFWQAGWRTLVWLGELFFVFPFLGVASHYRRQIFHDRLSDTMVISERKPVGTPDFWEKSFVQGVYAALGAFALIALIGVAHGMIQNMGDQSKVLSMLEENGELCPAVGEALKSWPEEKVSYGSERLSAAMAMFAAGLISKNCLAQETEHLSSRLKEEDPLLYLAQSFVQSENAKLSNEYLDRVCELDPKSESCAMSEVIGKWSEEDWDAVDKVFSEMKGTTNLHMAVWAIRHMIKQQRYAEAVEYIDAISPQKTLAPFLNMQRLKAYWNLNRFDEAQSVVAGSLDLIDLYDSVDMAAWLCSHELEQSCQKQTSLSCRAMNKYMKQNKELLADTELALGRIQYYECKGGESKPLQELADGLPQPRLRDYAEALLLKGKDKNSEAQAHMRSLAESPKKDEVSSLAQRKLIEWSASKENLEAYYRQWADADKDEDWEKLGKSLFFSYYSLGVFDRALVIGKELMNTPFATAEFFEAMVLSAYHSGKRSEAFALLEAYRTLDNDQAFRRRPAAEGEFQVVSRVLDQEYGAK
jgi:uncharacterized RDD family membrane protein YckC